jgi:putative transposase
MAQRHHEALCFQCNCDSTIRFSSLLALQKAMSMRKYRMLFSPNRHRKPGPKGLSAELIHLVVEMKHRNPNWGCPRIAQQIVLAFHIPIDKDVVRRILAGHYRPGQDSGGPSWLTFLGHMKDSLWSMDLFQCESAMMRPPWVLVVMDQLHMPDHWLRCPCGNDRWCRTL